MQGSLVYSDPAACAKALVPKRAAYAPKFHVCSVFRSGYSGACLGDSGGGLFYFSRNGHLVQFGITSFVTGGNCGEVGQKGFFTTVQRYEGSIRTIMKGNPLGYRILL